MINEQKPVRYEEAAQSLNIRFAWAIPEGNNVFTNQHHWVMCRDFLIDAIYWKRDNLREQKIYKFTIDTDKFEIYPCLSVEFYGNDKEKAQRFKASLAYLNHIENDWKPTEILLETKTKTGIALVLGFDERWLSSAFNISLYSFLIKVLSVDGEEFMDLNEDAFPYPENSYILGTKKYLGKALEKLNELEHKEFLFDKSLDYHDNNGFVHQLKHNKWLIQQLQ